MASTNVIGPDLSDQLLLGDQLAGASCQRHEDIECPRPETDRNPVPQQQPKAVQARHCRSRNRSNVRRFVRSRVSSGWFSRRSSHRRSAVEDDADGGCSSIAREGRGIPSIVISAHTKKN